MRKRNFGKGRLIYASEHNTAQTYIELNTREIAIDGGIRGIITGGTLAPHSTLEYTIILQPTIARTSTGERCVVSSSTNIFIKPSVDPGSGNEVYVAAYIEYAYQMSELDTDGDGVTYYKDYQNSYQISTIQGTIAATGTATKPTIPVNAILLCDILYDSTLYASGQIQSSDIDTGRQDRFDSQSIVNLKVTGTTELQGLVTIRAGIDMDGTTIINLPDPVDGDGIGDRDYNDARYVELAGDTMTGTLNVPNINVSSSMTIEDLTVNGTLSVDDPSTFGNNVNITGDLSVNAGDASVGGDLTVLGIMEAQSVLIPWAASTAYTEDEVVVYEEGIYKCTTDHTSTSNFFDDIIYWESIGGGGGTTTRLTISSHGFQVGDVLRYDSSADPDGYVKAKADDVDTLGQFVVIRVLDADNFIISSGGFFEDLTFTVNFTPNSWYYLSATVAGELTTTEAQLSNPMLYAIAANKAYVFPYRPAVGATMHVDEFTSSTGQTVFTLSKLPLHDDYITVSVDGVIQSTTAYNWSGTTLTFTSPLSGGEEIRVQLVHNILSIPGASMISDEFTVTSTGETEFTLSEEPISEDYLIVTIDGIVQHDAAYSVLGTTLTFTAGLTAGNEVRVQQIRNLNVIEPADFTLSVMDIYKVSPTVDRGILLATNGLSSGPISITDGNIVEIPDGYTWTIV